MDQLTLSAKVQIISVLGFAGHAVSAIATQLCCHSTEAAVGHM